MKNLDKQDLKWVGVDLHVHTPASKDYRGGHDDREYLEIIRRANEFSGESRRKAPRVRRGEDKKPVSCVAFTDHNSVGGFEAYKHLWEKTGRLRDEVRSRDPANSLLEQLEEDLDTLGSLKVLLGLEVKAYPGIHLLVICHESVETAEVTSFLEEIYGLPYEELAGDPTPVTTCTLIQVLDTVSRAFAGKAFVVAPHIDTADGLYEGLKDHGQVRMEAFRHPAIVALSFNKHETRDRVRELLRSPDYRRADEVALVQSSDFHGQPGSTVGQPRSYVKVPGGKVNFRTLKESLGNPGRVRCSIDFTKEEYEKLTKGDFLVKYRSDHGRCEFRETDFDDVASSICAMVNSDRGVLELEGFVDARADRAEYVTTVIDQLKAIVESGVQPADVRFMHRDLRFSPGKVSILLRPVPSDRLHTSNEHVYVLRKDSKSVATAQEIESVVAAKIVGRFGPRFEETLDEVSTGSTLLSKMPQGIPILLTCQDKLQMRLPKAVKVQLIEPISAKSRDLSDLIDETYDRARQEFTFGEPGGNATILWEPMPPRFREHYLRFTVFRVNVPSETIEKCSWGTIEEPAVVVLPEGGVGLVEPGPILADAPAMLLQPREGWADKTHALCSWLKSAFVIWYCAVHLGEQDLFLHLQATIPSIPVLKPEYEEMYRRLGSTAHNVILDEVKFMREVNRDKERGRDDEAELEKRIKRHNDLTTRQCLTLDREILDFLGFSADDVKYVSDSLRAIHLSDFGLSEKASGDQA